MQTFLARFHSEIKGVLSGFDRMRFRGTVRRISSYRGMMSYLWERQILLKEFKDWAMGLTDAVKRRTTQVAQRAGRAVIHLPSSATRKEGVALDIARRDGVTEGLVCVLTCTESCQTFEVGPNRVRKQLELRVKSGKCRHDYFYVLDPQFGLMHLRLQTWLPFSVHVCLNGREWLANLLRKHGVGFEQRDNCFVDVANVRRAQTLFDRQQRTDWDGVLNRLVGRWHPAHRTLYPDPLDYYWSAEETEWATDVLFRSSAALARVYPHFLQHAATTFGSGDVLRFLGKRSTPRVHGNFTGEVLTSLASRPEGTRVKHAVNRNSIKMYDKQGSVLRVETTINDPRDMKAYRAKEGDPAGKKSWRGMRKGVSDLFRRTEVSQQSNERYLESLAALATPTPLIEVVGKICRRKRWQGRPVRALQPLSEADGALLAAVARGEFAVNGFRNRDLRTILHSQPPRDPATAKRQAARITRQLRLLRGQGLIRKIPKTHRYQLTSSGRTTIIALLVAQQTNIQHLAQLAA
jgi:hypothetical protein